MKRKLTTIYAAALTALLAAGFVLVFVFAWLAGIRETILCVIGLIYGFVLSPILHELGHVSFAQIAKMDYVYVKFFCFKYSSKYSIIHMYITRYFYIFKNTHSFK